MVNPCPTLYDLLNTVFFQNVEKEERQKQRSSVSGAQLVAASQGLWTPKSAVPEELSPPTNIDGTYDMYIYLSIHV